MPARRTFVAIAGLGLVLCLGLGSRRLLPADDEPAPRKLAFLVGVKKYNHLELKDLDFPERDVTDLAAVLRASGFQVVALTTERGKSDSALRPLARNIRAQLKTLLHGVTKQDLILVGLAGHGLQPLESDESYFCPMDANPLIENGKLVEPESLIGIGELLARLRNSGIGDKLVLVDACRNDPSVRGRRGMDRVNTQALPAQTGVLLSCSPGEFSFEHSSLSGGHGVFFHHVIEGLKGSAQDADDHEITWDSLRAYVKKRVPATVKQLYGKDGGQQRPNEFGNLSGEPTVLAVARVTTVPNTPMPVPSTTQPAPGREPELLIAPFGADDIRTSRKAWAQYQQLDEVRTNTIGMKLSLIPAGEFQMGSTAAQLHKVAQFDPIFRKAYGNNEEPQHRVKITRPFYLGTYEVTKGQFRKFVDDAGYKTEAERDRKGGDGYTGDKINPLSQRATFTWRDWGVDQSDESPVVNVTHNDAVAFCEWLSKKEGKTYRLPTEAEWEYACRAGTTTLYYNGDDPENLTKIGNVNDATLGQNIPGATPTLTSSDGWTFTAPVGQFKANKFGIYDMAGNVWELCSDWYEKSYYESSPLSDPTGPRSGSTRVFRGGSWIGPARRCRSANRYGLTPEARSGDLGFRVAAVPK